MPSTDPHAFALARALGTASSRLSPPPTPWASVAIHGLVLAVWIALFALAFSRGGLLAWSVGTAYIAYDTLLQVFVGWNTRRLLAPTPVPTAHGSSATRPRVGVIVAAHNEAAVLPVTIAALLAQTDPPDEIVIADDGSRDATASLLTSTYSLVEAPIGEMSLASPTHPSLRWQRLPHGGKARALNAAIVRIESEIVLTVDADTLLDPRAIAAVRSAFTAEAGLVAVTGVITPLCKPTLAGRCLE